MVEIGLEDAIAHETLGRTRGRRAPAIEAGPRRAFRQDRQGIGDPRQRQIAALDRPGLEPVTGVKRSGARIAVQNRDPEQVRVIDQAAGCAPKPRMDNQSMACPADQIAAA